MCVCVCDIQMLLPEGIRRDNTKLCEEVEIPPSQPMPVGFEEKPVYISDLDEVGAPPVSVHPHPAVSQRGHGRVETSAGAARGRSASIHVEAERLLWRSCVGRRPRLSSSLTARARRLPHRWGSRVSGQRLRRRRRG